MSDDDERTTINKRLIKHSTSSSSSSSSSRNETAQRASLRILIECEAYWHSDKFFHRKKGFIYISYASTSFSVEQRVIGIAESACIHSAQNSMSFSSSCFVFRSVALSKIDSFEMMSFRAFHSRLFLATSLSIVKLFNEMRCRRSI